MTRLSNPLVIVFNAWKTQDRFTKYIVAISLILVIFAYLPTLQFHYVPQDQWRAFRYSTLEQTPYFRANACVNTVWKCYFRTGRPLVWITECVEHAIVAKISDFVYLRPISLSIVVFTALYLGSILAPIVGGLAMGVLAASAFLMAPGYSFMYLQGFPAAMVLVSVILAAASFNTLHKRLEKTEKISALKISYFLAPFLLFMSGCLIYPAWMFLVFPLALATFGFDDKNPFIKKSQGLLLTLFFYVSAAVFYYFFVKVTSLIVEQLTGDTSDLRSYAVALQLNPSTVWQRIVAVQHYFVAMSPLNFNAPAGLSVLLLGLFPVNIAFRAYQNNHLGLLSAVAYACLLFAFCCILLLAAIVPFLLSHMDRLSTRHLIPWYLFYCVTAVGLIFSVVKHSKPRIQHLASILTLAFFLLPVTVIQNKLSFLEVVTSAMEMQNMRSRLSEWLNNKGYLHQRYLLVVLPTRARPILVENMLLGANAGDNAVLSSSQNPVSLPWMINALLREQNTHPVGTSVELISCDFNQSCVNAILRSTSKVALGITNGDAIIRSITQPFVINNTTFTAKKINPIIQIIPLVKQASTGPTH